MEHAAPEKSLADYNLFDPQTLECPFHFYRKLREEAPVYQIPNTTLFIVSRHADIRQLLKQTDIYSNDFGHLLQGPTPSEEAAAILAQGWAPVDTMLTLDPPEHKKYRSLVNKVFSAARVEKMHDYIEQIVTELIDSFIDKGECDLLHEFAVPLPVYVIADQLGVPRLDLKLFKQWSDAFASRLGQLASKEAEIDNARQIVAFQHYFVEKLEQRRRDPQDDIISDLVTARIEDGRPLDTAELLSILQQLLVAGNETTTSAIAAGMLYLIQNPDQMAKLRADPGLIENACEEILRLETPTSGMWRIVKRDTELHGVKIPAGSMVMLRYAAANRDSEQFEDPERMDVCRANAAQHLAFGQGVHFCLGAMLARKEMQVAFQHLLQRLDDIRLTPGMNDLRHHPNVLLRGLAQLHISFRPA